jgi:uncharacterized membrane protein
MGRPIITFHYTDFVTTSIAVIVLYYLNKEHTSSYISPETLFYLIGHKWSFQGHRIALTECNFAAYLIPLSLLLHLEGKVNCYNVS